MNPRTNYSPYILRSKNDCTTAKCVKCLKEKIPFEFYKHSVRSDGLIRYRQICKECRKVKERKKKKKFVYDLIIKNGYQKCISCKKDKNLDEFYSNGCFSDGIKKYRTKCKECVLIDSKEKHPKNYENKIKIKHSSYKNYISSLLNHCSKRKGKEFNIDIQYLIDIYNNQNGICNISGVPMTYDYGSKITNISIDRIDSRFGYIKGNIQLLCYIANIMKNVFELKDLILFSEKIIHYNKNKINAV
jgi:hypothetical protein